MRKYETIFISDPDLQDQARADLFDKLRNIIARENGILLDFDEWGNKKLAYEIKNNLKGHYLFFDMISTPALISELTRNFNIWENVLKYMSIKIDKKEKRI